jgi:hypothetical protein
MQSKRYCLLLIACFVLLSAIYFITLHFCLGGVGFPLDDAYIHLQFARNLDRTGQMAFNRGVPSGGSTAPLYPILLTGFHKIISNWKLASLFCGATFGLGIVLTGFFLLKLWTGSPELALWGGMICLVASPTIESAYGGMESAAYIFAFLAGVWMYSTGRRRAASLVFVVGMWLRPELGTMLPFILLERILVLRNEAKFKRSGIYLELIAHLGIWMLGIASFLFYYWCIDGHFLPGTLNAKTLVPFSPMLSWRESFFNSLRAHHWYQAALGATFKPAVILVTALIGIWTVCPLLGLNLRRAIVISWSEDDRFRPARRITILTLLIYPFSRGLIDPSGTFWFQQQRYFAHLPALAILLVIGSLPLLEKERARISEYTPLRRPTRILAWAAVMQVFFLTLTVLSVGNILDMHVRMGEWLKAHSQPDDLIATNDIGAIGFISERPILDTVGLIDRQVVEHYQSGGTPLEYLRRKKPKYVVIFPGWYPKTCEALAKSRVFSIRLRLNIIAGGNELVVYEPDWNH